HPDSHWRAGPDLQTGARVLAIDSAGAASFGVGVDFAQGELRGGQYRACSFGRAVLKPRDDHGPAGAVPEVHRRSAGNLFARRRALSDHLSIIVLVRHSCSGSLSELREKQLDENGRVIQTGEIRYLHKLNWCLWGRAVRGVARWSNSGPQR